MQIPEFTRRRLASSVTGTPGIDTSGQRAFNSIAGAADTAATLSGNILLERKAAMDKAVAFDRQLTFESEASKATLEHNTEFADYEGDPVLRAEALKARVGKIRESMGEGMPSANSKLDFLQTSGTYLNGLFKSELKTASENQVVIGAKKLAISDDKISDSVYGLFLREDVPYNIKIGALNGAEQRRVQNIEISKPLIGPAGAQTFDTKSRQNLVEKGLMALVDKHPTDAVKFLKEPGVKEALGAEKYDDWKAKATKRAMDFKSIQKERGYEYVLENNAPVLEAFYAKDLDMLKINNIGDPKTREIMTDIYLESKSQTPQELAAREADLYMRWENFFVRDKKGKLTGDLKKEVSMKEVVELQHDYMRNFDFNRSVGALERGAKNYPDMLRQAIKNQKPNEFTRFFVRMIDVTGPVGAAIGKGVSDKAAAKDRALMADKFYYALGKVDINNPEQVREAVQTTLGQYQLEKNPGNSKYIIGEKYTFGKKLLTAIRNPDGSLGWDDGKK